MALTKASEYDPGPVKDVICDLFVSVVALLLWASFVLVDLMFRFSSRAAFISHHSEEPEKLTTFVKTLNFHKTFIFRNSR